MLNVCSTENCHFHHTKHLEISVILPDSLPLAFTMVSPTYTPIFSASSIISAYLNRANYLFPSVFPSKQFVHLDDIHALEAYFNTSEEPSFAAIDLSNLLAMSKTSDQSNKEELIRGLRSFLEHISQDDRYNLAVLTYATPSSTLLFKRDTHESQAPFPSVVPPQLPIGSISTCFTSSDACNNGTSSCSGRGQCVEASKAGRTCFVCLCGFTISGKGKNVKTEYWAGEKCERKDISGYVLQTYAPIITHSCPIFHMKAIRSPFWHRCTYHSPCHRFNIVAVYSWGTTIAEYPSRNSHKCKEGVNRR